MGKAKEETRDGKTIHFSVGVIIKRNEKFLMHDRAVFPFGWAYIAGHVDEGETEFEALKREVKEETGLELKNPKLLIQEYSEWNECSKGVKGHEWYLYEAEAEGEAIKTRESKAIGWFTIEEVKKLDLEPIVEYFFKKLKLI